MDPLALLRVYLPMLPVQPSGGTHWCWAPLCCHWRPLPPGPRQLRTWPVIHTPAHCDGRPPCALASSVPSSPFGRWVTHRPIQSPVPPPRLSLSHLCTHLPPTPPPPSLDHVGVNLSTLATDCLYPLPSSYRPYPKRLTPFPVVTTRPSPSLPDVLSIV